MIAAPDLVDFASDAAFAVDEELRVLDWNQRAGALLGYPPQLYNIESDPYELVDLADHPDHADTLERLTGRIETNYDLDRLPTLVTADQRRRRLIERANATGRIELWDFVSQPHIDRRFVRRGDAFPTVERRGYLAHSADDS